MSLTEHIQQHYTRYASRFDRSKLALPPARRWAIVACMDARLTVEEVIGIATGDAHIIRNAGGLVTDDALRSLAISTHLLGTNEFAIIELTGCGILTFEDEPVRRQISERTGADTDGLELFAFNDLEANLREQVRRVCRIAAPSERDPGDGVRVRSRNRQVAPRGIREHKRCRHRPRARIHSLTTTN